VTSKVHSLALTEAETRYLRKRVRWRLDLRATKPPWNWRLGGSTQRLHQLNELADTFVDGY
jgi:hypothetical protein